MLWNTNYIITLQYDINKNIAFLAPQKNGEKKLQVGGCLLLPQSPIWTVKLVPIMCEAKRHSQCSSRPTWLLHADTRSPKCFIPRFPHGGFFTHLKKHNYLQVIRWWCEKSGNPKIYIPWGNQTLGNQQLGLLGKGPPPGKRSNLWSYLFVGRRLKTIKTNFLGKVVKNSICITKQLLKSDLEIRKHRGARGSKFKIHRGFTHPKVHQSQKIICRKISSFKRPPRISKKRWASENKVFCFPTGTFSSNWRLPPPKPSILSPTLPATRPVFRILGLHRNLRGLEIRRHHRLSGHFFGSDPPGSSKGSMFHRKPGVLVEKKKQGGTVLSIEMLVVEWGSLYL